MGIIVLKFKHTRIDDMPRLYTSHWTTFLLFIPCQSFCSIADI